jgi:hypothetical protein
VVSPGKETLVSLEKEKQHDDTLATTYYLVIEPASKEGDARPRSLEYLVTTQHQSPNDHKQEKRRKC